MRNYRKYIPEGMRDILFDECAKKIEMQNVLRKIYKGRGYSEVISPTLEFYDVFNLENQPIEQEKMYKLFDNQGRIMVLRPDMTTPIARIVSTKIKKMNYPLKLCYTSNIFRVNEKLNGKLSEITQSGVEIIGSDTIMADAEVIITSIKALQAAGIKNFKIEIGEVGFFKSVLEQTGLIGEEKIRLTRIIENKNSAALKEFLNKKVRYISEKQIKILESLPMLFGSIDILDKAEKLAEGNEYCNSLEKIKQLYEIIKSASYEKYLIIDLGMVQNLNYYTGIIFRGYTGDVGDDILTGGRYDNLTGEFGNNKYCTGFAINVDGIMTALEKQNNLKKVYEKQYVIFAKRNKMQDAHNMLDSMISENKVVEISLFNTLEETKEYAEKNNKVLIII